MDRVWLAQYPTDVAPEVQVDAQRSLVEMLEQSFERFAGLPAFTNMGVSLTYAEVDRLSRAFAAYLQSELHLGRGDRIALMLPNLLQYPVALFGALRAGLTVVNVNPLYTPRELEHQLQDSGARAIVILENFAHTLEQVVRNTSVQTVIVSRLGDLFPPAKSIVTNLAVKYLKRMVPRWQIEGAVPFLRALRSGARREFTEPALEPDDVALLQYTGGTTGIAKGVVLRHANLVANVQQLSAWIASGLRPGEETAVIPLPLYHIYALTTSLVFNRLGARCVLITNPRDLPAFVKTLKQIPPTAIIGVNTLFRALLDAPGFSSIDFGRLKLSAAGGMAVQRAVATRWKEATGIPLVEGYGLSETSPVIISNRLDIPDWTGVIGLPIPSTEAAILDEEGNVLPSGEVGEICVRGPQVMSGYWNRPDETRKVFTRDGWFRTGDMGVMDERGYFRITDRKKDMIIVSGFKVFPNEVEDVITLHPDVLEVGAIGVPDARTGEAVKVIVVKRNSSLTEEAVLAHCRQHLTPYKVPKSVEFRTEPLPKTPIGKVLRRQLRAAQPPASAAETKVAAHAP